MTTHILGEQFMRELEAEVAASRKCLERMREDLFKYKPHEKSMEMGYLSVIVAEVPKWIHMGLEKGEIEFSNWERYNPTTVADMLAYFEKNVADAKESLLEAGDEDLEKMFYLKMGGKELMKMSQRDNVSSTLNHWVHHRGQLTVYMRLNNIPVPSIYGPSADEQNF